MRTITKKLNMTPGGIPLLIRVNQYDSDFSIVFTLYSSDQSWTLESGTTARIRGTKKSGTGYSADAMVNVSNSTVTITGDQQMTAVAGLNTYEVVLYDGELELSSANFFLYCEQAAMSTNTITDDTVLAEITDFNTQIAAATAAANRAEAAADSVTIDSTLTQSGQAADAKVVGDEITGLKENFNELENNVGVSDVTYTAVSGYYINERGLERPSGGLSRSNPIAVTKNTIVDFTATGYNTNTSMIATSNAEGTEFKSKVVCIDSAQHTYQYIAEEDGYIVVSYKTNALHSLVFSAPKSNASLDNRISTVEDSNVLYLVDEADVVVTAENTPVTVAQTGKYIKNNGDLSSSSNFNLSTEIEVLAGQTITFNAMGYLTSCAILAKVNTDATYTPLIVSQDSLEHQFSYRAPYNMRVVISSHKNITPTYSIFGSKLGKLQSVVGNMDYVAFATLGVIGDSLASGASNYSGGVTDRPVYSWGKYIEREHGIAVTLFSAGGTTTRSWLTGSFGLAALNNSDPLDCYIIGLGVNDAYSLGSAYLGSISDIHVGSESENADTYYGNYSRIIASIKAKSPRAKIFCLTNPRGTNSPASDYNAAAADIVALYTNTYLINLIEDDFYTSTDFRQTWYSAHSTAVGYKLIAQNIYNHLNDIIQENVKEFLDIQWIVSNHD